MIKKKKLVIYDDSYFKHVTINNITEEKSMILHDTFTDICKNPKNYAISVNTLQDLIQSDKLIIEHLSSVYENISHRDKIICLSLLKSKDFDVTVYTKDDFLALDLLLNNINVQNVEFDNYFVNIGKSEENEDIIVYDTCSLFESFHLIDFSKNIHYFPVCVLEELVGIVSDNDPFFKFLYLYNKYPQNVRILNTVSSTQRGGRYSYTDLLILYSAIRLQNKLPSYKKLTLLTKDRTLIFESMNLNVFNVKRKFDYFDNKTETTVTVEEVKEQVTLPVECDHSSDCVKCTEENLESAVIINENNDDEDAKDTTQTVHNNQVIYDNSSVSNKNTTNLNQLVKESTNNYTQIKLKKLGRKNVLDKEDIVEQVYSSHFKIIVPLPKKRVPKNWGNKCYEMHPGYWITFKNNPQTHYKVVKIKSQVMELQKL